MVELSCLFHGPLSRGFPGRWGEAEVVGGLRHLEDALDQRTAEFIALQKAAVEHAVVSPIKSLPLQSALGPWAAGNVRKPTMVATEAPDGQDLIPALPQVRHTQGHARRAYLPHQDIVRLAMEATRLASLKFLL